jgi:t-SNARE complex subunit (syntaxin)
VFIAPTAEKEQELTSGLNPLISETNTKAQATKQALQELRSECDSIQTSCSSQKDLDELRIRDNLVNTLTRKFVEVIKAYQNAQQKLKLDIKKRMRRQVLILIPDASPEVIEEVLRSGGGSGEVVKNVILKVLKDITFPFLFSLICTHRLWRVPLSIHLYIFIFI